MGAEMMIAWPAGTEIDKADRALRHASHVHAHATERNKPAARQALRLAALAFAAELSDLAKKGGAA